MILPCNNPSHAAIRFKKTNCGRRCFSARRNRTASSSSRQASASFRALSVAAAVFTTVPDTMGELSSIRTTCALSGPGPPRKTAHTAPRWRAWWCGLAYKADSWTSRLDRPTFCSSHFLPTATGAQCIFFAWNPFGHNKSPNSLLCSSRRGFPPPAGVGTQKRIGTNKSPHLLFSIPYCLTNGVQFKLGRSDSYKNSLTVPGRSWPRRFS